MGSKSYLGYLSKAIDEIRRAPSVDRASTPWLHIPNVPMPDGSFVFTTKEGLQAIYGLGNLWYQELTPEQKSSITKNWACGISLRVFGEMLEGLYSLEIEINSDHISDFKRRLYEKLDKALHDVIHHLPCHIFQDTSIGKFDIGPVEFRPRLEWLDEVELIAKREIKRNDLLRSAWGKGKLPASKKSSTSIVKAISWVWSRLKRALIKVKAEQIDSSDKYSNIEAIETEARNVVNGIGSCSWMATIRINRNEVNKSKERAHTAMRLALDSLSVLLDSHEALKLRGPMDILRATHAFTMIQTQGNDIRTTQSFDMPGISGKSDSIKDFIKSRAPYRRVAGEAIRVMISELDANIPELKKRWCEALYWYGESYRDVADFIAIAHYGMTLDILAKGRGENAIIKLVSALLGCGPNDQFLSDGKSLKQTVNIIYKDFRSQLSHGGRFGLLQELTIDRRAVNIIVAIILEKYVFCLSIYNGQDNYESFLKEIPNLVLKIKDIN